MSLQKVIVNRIPLLPVFSILGMQPRADLRATPRADRDFIRDHLRALRAKDAELKQLRATAFESMASRTAPIATKYAHVQSRLFQTTRSIGGVPECENAQGTLNLHKNFGKVPAYLEQAKASLEEKKRTEVTKQMAPKVQVPDGHRMLSEEERVETIELLEKRKADVELQLRKMPLRIETDAQKKRHSDLNKRFADIEQAIRFLSRPNVIIKDD